MKSIISVAVLSMVLMAAPSRSSAMLQAEAYFGNDHLTQVFYTDSNKIEIGVDLGKLGTDFTLTDTNKVLKTVNYAALANSNGADVGELRMGMYIDSLNSTKDTVWDHYFVTIDATTPATPPAYSFYNWYLFMDYATNAIANYYTGTQVTKLEGGAVVTANPENFNSYRTQMDMSGFIPGTYRSTNTDPATAPQGELDLANLNASYLDLYLWHFSYDGTTKSSVLVAGPDVDYSAKIRFHSDGTTILNPVPLPETAWILGSSLLFLIGLRRRGSSD